MDAVAHQEDRPQLYLGLMLAILLWTAAFALTQ